MLSRSPPSGPASTIDSVRKYGVKQQVMSAGDVEQAVEELRMLGYTVVDGAYTAEELDAFADHFDAALKQNHADYGGRDALAAIDENNTIRAMLSHDLLFLSLARNEKIIAICEHLLGSYFVLNQQNGIVNPPLGQRYNQGAFHRDLPYQHFVASQPLALNALFCIDQFTLENGATLVLPATHKQESFPSDDAVRRHALQVTAPRGSFIVLDCMVYHSGGVNQTATPRRAVNHVYSIPLIRQQFNLPKLLGAQFAEDPVLGPFLGYGVSEPASIAEYYAGRSRAAKS